MRVIEIPLPTNVNITALVSNGFDTLNIYSDTTDNGMFTTLAGSVALAATQSVYSFVDVTGTDTTWYKFTYYKSTVTTAESAKYPVPIMYASASDLKTRLNEVNTGDERTFLQCVAAATNLIRNFCQREFVQKTETRYYEGPSYKGQYTGRKTQMLFMEDCLSVSSIVVDYSGGQSGATLTTYTLNTHCYLWPQEAPQRNEPYQALRFIPAAVFPIQGNVIYDNFQQGVYWPQGYRANRITGVWGWPTNDLTNSSIPADVSEACLEVAARIYKGRDNAYSRIIGNSDLGLFKISDDLFNKDTKNLLANYARINKY